MRYLIKGNCITSKPIRRTCCDMPVSSGVEMHNSTPARDINRATYEARRLFQFMDGTYLGPVERRNEFINELCRDYKERTLQLNNLIKKIQIQEKKETHQKLNDLGRFVHLVSTARRTKQTLLHMHAINKGHRRRRVKLPLPRNNRQMMEDNQDNLCQAVQGMQLNSENPFRKSECMQSGDKFLAKLNSPSEIAEDLSKLCMKD